MLTVVGRNCRASDEKWRLEGRRRTCEPVVALPRQRVAVLFDQVLAGGRPFRILAINQLLKKERERFH